MNIEKIEKGISISDFGGINLDVTLDCGQAFRWECDNGIWHGVVRGTEVRICQKKDRLEFYGIDENRFNDIFYDYFDFGRDYNSVIKGYNSDGLLKASAENYGIIRILRQEPWEALCSFIISACNNIPRIKGIISRLCENFGEKTGESYTFPTPEKIAGLNLCDLDVLRAGYRNEFILDGAEKISSGEIDLEALKNTDMDTARNELMKIKGVGKKVADCTLLFGLGFIDAFPVDRHIKRITEECYPEGLPECIKESRGIAQQYMFHFQRTKNF